MRCILRKYTNPRISGGFNASADSVYQALFSAYEKEPGVEARLLYKM